MSYTVTDETIRLNKEATDLAGQVNRVRNDAWDLAKQIERLRKKHEDMILELGSLAWQQMAKEAELREAVERGPGSNAGTA